MVKTSIHTIGILPFGMLNAYLLVNGNSAVLVDTGLPNSEEKIETALRQHGLDWSHLKLIIVTHGHIDHAGSAVKVRELSSARILAHKGDAPYLRGAPPVLKPSGPFGKMFNLTGAILRPYQYFKPDIIIDEEGYDLKEFGLPVTLIHTPGHTPGSISVLLENDIAIIGDLAASGILLGGIALRGRPKPPPFEEDRIEVKRSLSRLLQAGFRTFYLGHGGPVRNDQLNNYLKRI